MKNEYLETNEAMEFLDSLASLSDFLEKARSEPKYWKWSFIALHMTIQSAMVIALRRTDGFGPLSEKKEKKYFEQVDATGKHQQLPDYLMKFLQLYQKIKKEGTIQSAHGESYIPKGNEDKQMEFLNNVRNDYIHFTPKIWMLHVGTAPDLFLSLIEIPKYLVSQCRKFHWIDETSQEVNFDEHFKTIESTLNALKK
jgi:hypothetical protein